MHTTLVSAFYVSSTASAAVRSSEVVASFAVQFRVPDVSYVERFVGQKEGLNAIYKELHHDRVGKTQLALAYAQQHRNEHSVVFWVDSKSEDTLK